LDTEASDITYLCLTCHGDENGTLQFRYDPNDDDIYDSVTGQMLRNKLDQLGGKVVVFLNTCYAGTIIDRGENEYPETAFITDFLGQSRSGELANDKYLVLCSSSDTERSYGYYQNGNPYVTIGLANKYWMLGGGWDVDTNYPTEQMNADTNPQNSIVTLNELYSYSSNSITVQHVTVYPINCDFTVFAKLD